jgi:hypothetical protein
MLLGKFLALAMGYRMCALCKSIYIACAAIHLFDIYMRGHRDFLLLSTLYYSTPLAHLDKI